MRLVGIIGPLISLASTLGAQVLPEARFEVVSAGGQRHAEAGLGLGRPLGTYLRGGVTASYDVWNEIGQSPRARVEGQVRFLLDPFGERDWGLSFAGGLGVHERTYLVVAADLEGPRIRRVRPAIQLALGGGVRAAFILRAERINRR